MRKISLGLLGAMIWMTSVMAAARVETTTARSAQTTSRTSAAVGASRTSATPSVATRETRTSGTTTRTSGTSVSSRSATTPTVTSRTPRVSRAATVSTTARSARTGGTVSTSPSTARSALARVTGATNAVRSARGTTTATTSRAALARAAVATSATGNGYNTCRDAYFTCMDQFCAKQNDTYRRCVCSARLDEIKEHERVLAQTGERLQTFKDLNIEVITKTPAEVNAMLNPSQGESVATGATDKSGSASVLAGISDVLNKTRTKSLSTQGQLDIAGDINAIWSTTDLAAGTSLADLTGEALYNAVHTQCAEMIAPICGSTATFNMVVSAYGMYIENDCTTLAGALGQKTNVASGEIRATEREMNLARLENYNVHNSAAINDCIANVRNAITNDMACGTDYVHCIDITGLYLNRDTGEPIYSADFYQLETQLSLSGDILTNDMNMALIAELNRKKSFAESSLDQCRDVAKDVWDEFMRQAITEIYQSQQDRVRTVKNECLNVVNQCYDDQSKSLKDFSNIKEQLLLGQRLELSEELCRVKLDACSNLYGGGPGGMALLGTLMHGITDQKIAKECKATLTEFARDICAVPTSDSIHTYPYGCRTYAPGSMRGAQSPGCTNAQDLSYNEGNPKPAEIENPYMCLPERHYKSCNKGYYLCMASKDGKAKDNLTTANPTYNINGGDCCACNEFPETGIYKCSGSTERPISIEDKNSALLCPDDYIGSVYQRLARYALQVCVRPSWNETGTDVAPNVILQDINTVMDTIRVDMTTQLNAECERLGGIWTTTPKNKENPTDKFEDQHVNFYNLTGTNLRWGYCQIKDDTTTTKNNTDPSNPSPGDEEKEQSQE